MHAYCDLKGTLPTPASYDAKGWPLLSWRVHLLPFLGLDELYKQFKLDEAWDSPHNRTLVAKMPAIYGLAPRTGRPAGGAVGSGTIFPCGKGLKLSDIVNGTSNTIMVLECDEAHRVIWTKPDDWPPQPVSAAPGSQCGFLGCSRRRCGVPTQSALPPATLRSMISRLGGPNLS